tara:strand:- start:393 stop:1070 length:678 start_codon:yes stop_codon:yes gene_type:complete
MTRKTKGKFDMKGHTLPGIKQVKGKMGDGRASSSPFQINVQPNKWGAAEFLTGGVFGKNGFFGNGNQKGNAHVEQPGQSYAKANFDQLQAQGNPNADANIVQPTTTPPVVDPVVDPNAGVSGQGTIPIQMKSPVRRKTDPDAPGTPGEPGYEPPVDYVELLEKTPSIVATDRWKKEYNQSEEEQLLEQKKESEEETERINKPPATRPPMFSDADAHRKVKKKINK